MYACYNDLTVIVIKEKSNQWYGVGAYYTAKLAADVPFQLLFPIMYSTIL